MDRATLENLYDEHADALFAFFLSYSRDETNSRDLLQEFFTKLARRGLPRRIGNPRAYLLRAAYHLSVDWSRRHRVRQRGLDRYQDEPATELFQKNGDPDSHFIATCIESALLALPLEQRLVVQMKEWDQLTFDEIGHALDISPNTAASRYRYGIDKLRGQLRPLYKEIKDTETP